MEAQRERRSPRPSGPWPPPLKAAAVLAFASGPAAAWGLGAGRGGPAHV